MDLIVQSRRKSEASDCWYEDGEGVMDEGGMGGPPVSRTKLTPICHLWRVGCGGFGGGSLVSVAKEKSSRSDLSPATTLCCPEPL